MFGWFKRKVKIVEKIIYKDKIVIGEPTKTFLFEAKVFDKEKYDLCRHTYSRYEGYFYNKSYHLSCKEAFSKHPDPEVTKIEVIKIGDTYFSINNLIGIKLE